MFFFLNFWMNRSFLSCLSSSRNWLFADGEVGVVCSVAGEVEASQGAQGVVVMEEILAVIRQLDLVLVITRLLRQNWVQDQADLRAGIRALLRIFPVLNMEIWASDTWTYYKMSCLPLHVYNAWRRANQGLGIVWNDKQYLY